MHQVADLPHQGLVTVDQRLGSGAIVVEAGAAMVSSSSRIAASHSAMRASSSIDALLVGLRGALDVCALRRQPRFFFFEARAAAGVAALAPACRSLGLVEALA